MSRLRQSDIVSELVELCHDVMSEIRQQLLYYRASVYKDETASIINNKVEQLRMIAVLFGDELAQEPMRDYDAMKKAGAAAYVPGECSFSNRLSCLLTGLNEQLERLGRGAGQTVCSGEFTDNVQKQKDQIIAICRHGSRQWAFFRAL